MASRQVDPEKRAADIAAAKKMRAEFDRHLAENNTTVEKVIAGLKQFGEDNRYLNSIWADLLEQHPDCWVAVYCKEVVAVAPTQEELSKSVAAQGLRLADISCKFLRTKPLRLIV